LTSMEMFNTSVLGGECPHFVFGKEKKKRER
jgi:hypothetical protein